MVEKALDDKISFRTEKELAKKIRKLSKLTGFTISHICNEIIKVCFKNGITKDLFWVYIKDHSDPFLQKEILKGKDNCSILKEAFSVIEAVFSEQEIRLIDLEKNTKIVNKIVRGKFRQLPLEYFLKEVKGID